MIHRFPSSGLWLCAWLVAGCAGAGEPDPNAGAGSVGPQTTAAPAATTAAPSGQATVAPAVTATATASAATPPPPAHDVDGPDGVRRMAKWNGPVEGEAITGKKAWVLGPNMQVDGSTKLSFETPALLFVDVVAASAKEVVFEIGKNRYAVPAALARAGSTKGLKKGMVARCASDRNGLVGRLEAVDAKGASCWTRLAEQTQKLKLAPEEVLPVQPDKLTLGSPVVATSAGSAARHDGWVAAESGTEVWVVVERQFPDDDRRVNGTIFKVDKARVQAIDAARAMKVGDACLARQISSMGKCKIASVIDGGIAYTVSFDDGGSPWKEWPLDLVVPAPKDAAAKPSKK